MQSNYQTPRLLLDELKPADAAFILELVNSPGWIRFIGDRNVRNREDAAAYVQKIISNPDVDYRIVRITGQQIPIGIITLIKRDYLDHHDIGFAFLDAYAGQGYAREAASVVLNDLKSSHTYLLAITINENVRSIQLLEKLGFGFSHELHRENETLLMYSISFSTT